jgi:hypothetical protein
MLERVERTVVVSVHSFSGAVTLGNEYTREDLPEHGGTIDLPVDPEHDPAQVGAAMNGEAFGLLTRTDPDCRLGEIVGTVEEVGRRVCELFPMQHPFMGRVSNDLQEGRILTCYHYAAGPTPGRYGLAFPMALANGPDGIEAMAAMARTFLRLGTNAEARERIGEMVTIAGPAAQTTVRTNG